MTTTAPAWGTAGAALAAAPQPQGGERKPFTWDELGALVQHTLGSIDHANGPAIAQSRLRLFGKSPDEVKVTLYRDNHAWCPYSQKVWMWLEEQRVPYRVEKVALSCYGQKEAWYKELVPSGQVPSLGMNGKVIVESDRIIEALEKEYGVLHKSVTDPSTAKMARLERATFEAWLQWLTRPSRSTTEEKTRQKRFVQCVAYLEKCLAAEGGPYFLDDFSVADVLFAPFLERMNATLFYFKGFKLRGGGFENIDRWFDAMETRHSYRGSLSDFHTHCHVMPPVFGTCYELGSDEQQRCKRLVDEGPFLEIPDVGFAMPPDAAQVCLARAVKHHSSVLKQNPHRHGNSDEAFRCALTYLATGVKLRPPDGTHESLRYIRDRVCVPRDMPPHSAELFRHVCEATAALDGDTRGTPIPQKHRLDQEPFAFIKASQRTELEMPPAPP